MSTLTRPRSMLPAGPILPLSSSPETQRWADGRYKIVNENSACDGAGLAGGSVFTSPSSPTGLRAAVRRRLAAGTAYTAAPGCQAQCRTERINAVRTLKLGLDLASGLRGRVFCAPRTALLQQRFGTKSPALAGSLKARRASVLSAHRSVPPALCSHGRSVSADADY